MLNASSVLPFGEQLLYWFSERYPSDFLLIALL